MVMSVLRTKSTSRITVSLTNDSEDEEEREYHFLSRVAY